MTVRGVDLPARLLWGAALAIGVVALAVVFLANGAGRSAAATASITCDADALDFGTELSCDIAAGDDALLHWGDGTIEPATASTAHAIQAVGPVDVTVTDADGAVLASHGVAITPDLDVECEYGDPKPVYELAPALEGDLREYDYVYLLADGTKVVPGDARYPADLYERLDLELSVLGEEPIIGQCTATSLAADALGGHVTYHVQDAWHPETKIRTRKATPGTRGHWDGVQPITVTVVAEADGFQASEQMGVYWGGCG